MRNSSILDRNILNGCFEEDSMDLLGLGWCSLYCEPSGIFLCTWSDIILFIPYLSSIQASQINY